MLHNKLTKYRPRFLRTGLCLLMAFCFCMETLAVEEPYLNELKGSQVVEGGLFTVTDEKFASPTAWNLIQQNISVNDIVSFEINFDSTIFFYDKPFDCTVNFKIYIYGDHADTSKITDSITHSNISLKVHFDTTTGKAYKGIALYKFTNAHKYRIKILSIASPQLNPIPAIFRLKGQILVDRQYIFQDNSTDITRYAVINGNQLQLNWTPTNYPGAEVFDLEYTHVDGASLRAASIRNYQNGNQYFVPADSLKAWFVNNNTRITTASAGYLMNIPYDSGFVLFRIRGAQIHYPDGVRWEGNWNYQASEASGTCSTCPSGVVFFNPHESRLNWQYAATFAEEGKRKEVVSYFDGTLRNRQSVTIANSENKTVVQETIYDALGRPTLSLLPAPTNDSTIHFFRGFNNNQAGTPYSFADLLYNNCATTAAAVSSSSGAGRYYSSSNEFLNKYYYAPYIPAADGYPFSVTEYMADNTGRMKAQGGLGPTFQLGQGHATKYFYGKPSQTELDRLFGTEAGNASHYLKNMVVDPNGQISVSYLNAGGKTIATALAGSSPVNMHPLPSGVSASTQVSNDLMQPEDFLRNPEDYSISATTTFLAPVTGTYVLKYRVDPLRMEKTFGPIQESTICSNCYYDLEITVKDDCNNIIKQETKAAGNIFATNCATPPPTLAGTINTPVAAIGEYYVTYRLVISREALDFYDSTHLVKNTELKKINSFLLEEIKNTDFSGCFNNCETCLDALGTKQTFIARFVNLYQADSLNFDGHISMWVSSLYDSLYKHCQSIQAQCSAGSNICDEKLQLLKMDVTPGGQYAEYDTTTYALIEPGINVLAKRHQIAFFTDANGNRDSVTLYTTTGEDSVRVDVKDLNDAQFITHWKDEWADSLATLHPEYCQYLWCLENSASFAFDKEIENWHDADSVMAKGWFHPDQYDAILAYDPFFLPGGSGYGFRGKMQDSLRLFSRTFARTSLSDKNILRFIDVVLYCKSQYNGWESCSPDNDCRSRNREWFLYSQLYLNLKRYFYEDARRFSTNPVFANCVNCYIGKDLLGASGATPPTASYVAFTDPTCNFFCPAGVYNPFDKDNISLFIQYGNPSVPPSSVPAGYSNCRFYSAYNLQTAANNNCKFFNVWVCTYDSTCAPFCPTLPGNFSSSCPDNPLAALYQHKIRRYPEYVNADRFLDNVQQGNPQQNSAAQQQVLLAECRSTCEAQADIWMKQLKGCTTDATKLAQLKQALIDICSRGCSIERPFGASSIPADSPAVWHSFEEAMIGILGPGSISESCTVALLANPYPHDKQPVYAERLITETNYEICQKIIGYRNTWTSSGSGLSFHSYLLKTLRNGYQLDSLELNDLLNSCTNCNGLLKDDIVLPPAFEPNAIPCLVCNDIQNAQSAFNAKFPGLSTTHDNYEVLFTNFFNHRFGYGLTYDQYRNYSDSCSAQPSYAVKLCNQAITPEAEVENNGNSCMADLFATALTNAGSRYVAYIDSVRRDFREAYMTRCMNVQPALTMTAELYEYHYTLYYYDQSGSLVKTIPPEGVTLLNNTQLDQVKLHRLLQKEGCYQYSDSILFNNNGQIAWNLANAVESGPWSLEMMTNLSAHANQVLVSKLSEYTYDTTGGVSFFYRHAGFIIKLKDDKLEVELYGIGADTVQRKALGMSIPYASAIMPVGRWTHFVAARTGIPAEPIRIWINGNQVALVFIENRFDSAVIHAGNAPLVLAAHVAPHLPVPGKLQGTIKNLRLYNRIMGVSEIRQNAYNNCQLPVRQQGLAFWSAMNDATNNLVSDVITRQSGQLTGFTWQPFAGVFPKHVLPSFYQYNSLRKIVLQYTPDGDTTQFWYDRLNRLTASQNREQKDNASYSGTSNRFSYTRHDALSRITEVGEKSGSAINIRSIDMLDSIAVKNWLGATGANRQVSKTIYDNPVNLSLQSYTTSRKRVVASIYLENAEDSEGDSTLYGYDISGNVKSLVQHVKALVMADATNGKKRIDYNYDLVSGNVNTVTYQEGKGDQFFYKYKYDADNRMIRAYTSRDKLIWNEEASYTYYLNGPLARTELGNLKVQGVDYAYTIQGWMKGINGDALIPAREIGKDGHSGSLFSRVSKDVYCLQLGYYNQDYKPTGRAAAGAFSLNEYQAPTLLDATGNQSFNGNISYTTLALSRIRNGSTFGYTYGYDQLNRLTQMRQHTTSGNWNNSQIITAYRESIAYDANGNILQYLRHGVNDAGLPLDMDSLTYLYNRDINGRLVNNQLNYVKDAVGSGNYSVDIDSQTPDNYQYDKIGNLVEDAAEGIENIRWTAYGKINRINKNTNTVITLGYDAGGNRTSKQVTSAQGTTHSFYVRDAKGKVLAVYSNQGAGSNLNWSEQHLYGSSRLGMWNLGTAVPATPPVVQNNNPINDSLLLGSRMYELSNHLGNVLVTISDKKIGMKLASSMGVEFYTAETLSQQDYYPFGMLMPGRQLDSSIGYRYGFNGKENDNEVNGEGTHLDYGKRVYDSRLGRFLSEDPLAKQYPELTPYQFASNSPIEGIDIDGLEYITYRILIIDGLVECKTIEEDHRTDFEEQLNIMHKDKLTFTRTVNYGDRGNKPTKETYSKNFYDVYSMGFGPLGRGVLHIIEEYDTKSVSKKTSEIFFDKESSQAPMLVSLLLGRVGPHGIFYGEGCPTLSGKAHNFKTNPYDFSLAPIDEVDEVAKAHDMEYQAVYERTHQYDGWFDDIHTIDADKVMVAAWEAYLKRAIAPGFKDKYTGRPASEEALQKAQQGVSFFKNIVIPHKEYRKVKLREQERQSTLPLPFGGEHKY